MVGLTASQAIIITPSLFSHENYQDYYDNVIPFVFSCNIDQIPEINDQVTRNPLKYWLHCISFNLTGYPNTLLIPFAVGILPLVYYLGYYLTNDKRVGVISITTITINPYYSLWVNSGTYDQVWAFFLLLSVVLLFKHQGKGIISYIISIAGKSMALTYFPMWIYSIWKIKRNPNSIIIISSLVILLTAIAFHFNLPSMMIGSPIGFFSENLTEALTANISTFWMLLPLLIGMIGWSRAFKPKKQIANKSLVLVWILGVFVMTSIIHIFTQQQTYGYRYVPLAAFVSVYLGQVIIDTYQYLKEDKLKQSVYKP